jgi:hypothetical protein
MPQVLGHASMGRIIGRLSIPPLLSTSSSWGSKRTLFRKILEPTTQDKTVIQLTRISRVSKDLGVSERIIGEWISKGILRHYRVGRLVFLDPQEVVEDIKNHSATHSPAPSADEETEEVPDCV